MKTPKVRNTSLLRSVFAQVENGDMVLEIEISCSQGIEKAQQALGFLVFFLLGFEGGEVFVYLQEPKESIDVLRFQGLVAYSSVG
jgi:hypothetical protein